MAESSPGASIGRNVRAARERNLFSRRDLAERSGLSLAGIDNLERGLSARPRRRTIEKLAEALDVDIGVLMEETAYPLAEAPPSQRSLFNGGEEERREPKPPEPPEAERIHDLRSWAAFFNGFSKRWSEETPEYLASGRIPFNWGLEKQCAALQLLRSALEEPSIGGRDDIEPELSQEEQQAKLELSRATDELFRAANKAYEAQRSLGKNAGGIPDSMIASQRRHLAVLRNTA
jgi:transcriptional regulator with XRE-family HTH domain